MESLIFEEGAQCKILTEFLIETLLEFVDKVLYPVELMELIGVKTKDKDLKDNDDTMQILGELFSDLDLGNSSLDIGQSLEKNFEGFPGDWS